MSKPVTTFVKCAVAVLMMVCGFTSRVSHAATPTPAHINVSVTCSCDDAMGKAYVNAVKELLGKDGHYREVAANAAGEETLRINIISMPITTAEGMPGSALSIVCSHNGAMMHQFVETCTHIPILDCARSMVSGLSDVTD